MSVFKRDGVGSFLPPQRIETLADGVFAIVMTLMVFQFSVPLAAAKAELPGKLLELLPAFYSYVLSFVVLAMFWSGHHSAFHHISRSDESVFKLIVEGASDRLRPVILTTLTTMAGLLPLAYGIGGADLYMAPIALALGYGLVFATLLTLVLVPCLYMIFHDIGRAVSRGRKAGDAES